MWKLSTLKVGTNTNTRAVKSSRIREAIYRTNIYAIALGLRIVNSIVLLEPVLLCMKSGQRTAGNVCTASISAGRKSWC